MNERILSAFLSLLCFSIGRRARHGLRNIAEAKSVLIYYWGRELCSLELDAVEEIVVQALGINSPIPWNPLYLLSVLAPFTPESGEKQALGAFPPDISIERPGKARGRLRLGRVRVLQLPRECKVDV